MDHLRILNQIFEVVSENLENGTPRYIYSAAIYSNWSKGNDVEQDLARRLTVVFADELEYQMNHAYSNMKHAPDRPEKTEYCREWIVGRRRMYSDHPGLLASLDFLERDIGLVKIEDGPSLL